MFLAAADSSAITGTLSPKELWCQHPLCTWGSAIATLVAGTMTEKETLTELLQEKSMQ